MKKFFDWLLGNEVLIVTGTRLHAYAEHHQKFVFNPTCKIKIVANSIKPYYIYEVELCRCRNIECPEIGSYRVLSNSYIFQTFD